jgi:hypothetical protein
MLLEKNIIVPNRSVEIKRFLSSCENSTLEFRCYFCDELKDEEPYFFQLSSQRKEAVCSRCREKMEAVRRLKRGDSKVQQPE